MRAKILLVDGANERRANVPNELLTGSEILRAGSAAQALELLRADEAIAVVVSERTLPDARGLDFLTAVHAERYEVVTILIAGAEALEEGLSALRGGDVQRLLNEPCSREELAAALLEGLARHADLERQVQESEELRFSMESLAGFTATLEERIATQTAALRRLHRFAMDLNAASSMQAIVALAAEAAHDVLRGRAIHVQVWDDESEGARIEASAGAEMSAVMHCMPLCTREGQIGEIVIDVGIGPGARLCESDLDLIASIGSSTAVATHHELRRRERDQSQHATILALARLSEQRDNETGRHLERVAGYCKLIAEGLRADGHHLDVVDDEYIENLVRSSPLHDIGKVGIPDSILLKPGKLTAEEWEIMKTHAELGALTLDSVIQEFGSQAFLAMGRDIAWYHHERWDGTGYPRRMRGEAIPLAARILALADVYDALTTVRPYKEAWTHAAAIEWVRAHAGTQFDPAIVASFLARETQADEIRARLADRAEDMPPTSAELVARAV